MKQGNLGNLINRTITEWVIKRGEKVLMGTTHCKKWKKQHQNCQGCISELGCQKVAAIHLLIIEIALDPSKLENVLLRDALEEKHTISIYISRILEAKTIEEIDRIIGEAEEVMDAEPVDLI